ncbi:MAG TPA: phosphoenolpyruvate--protein phosphotransferase [Mycobacteriales bacterium]
MTATSARDLTGIGVSPGAAVGPVERFERFEPAQPPDGPAPADVAAEQARLTGALTETAADYDRRAAAATGTAAEVLGATALIAADPGLADGAAELVAAGTPAPRAVWDSFAGYREMLAAAGGYLGARVADLDDVRDRVLARLLGQPMPGLPDPGHPYVLVARDLAPADTATLRPEVVQAIVTEEGGPTSHTAILAAALGIPAVVACHGALELADGVTVAVDGAAGTVVVGPDDEAIAAVRRITEARARRSGVPEGGGRTADGHKVQLLANIGDAKGMADAVAAGAEGVGLFRTEFLYLDRADAPDLAEQTAQYREVFQIAAGRKVVVRTLDAGADKPLPFMAFEDEPNPALGVRGLRTQVRRPQILSDQLDAIAAAAKETGGEVWVMAPMVATPEEAGAFGAEVHRRGLPTAGIMVEIPAVALTARHCLADVEFASIGSNDLTQYAMAADRESAALAALNTPWQPGLLQLIALTAKAGNELGKPVGVCGEAAGDPALAVVLVGLGITSLSMTPRGLGDVAAVVGSVDLATARELAALALDARSAEEGRAAVRERLPVLADIGR